MSFIKSKTNEAAKLQSDNQTMMLGTFKARQTDSQTLRSRERERERSASGGTKVAMIGSIELQMAAAAVNAANQGRPPRRRPRKLAFLLLPFRSV